MCTRGKFMTWWLENDSCWCDIYGSVDVRRRGRFSKNGIVMMFATKQMVPNQRAIKLISKKCDLECGKSHLISPARASNLILAHLIANNFHRPRIPIRWDGKFLIVAARLSRSRNRTGKGRWGVGAVPRRSQPALAPYHQRPQRDSVHSAYDLPFSTAKIESPSIVFSDVRFGVRAPADDRFCFVLGGEFRAVDCSTVLPPGSASATVTDWVVRQW